jgi:hypothetical protein
MDRFQDKNARLTVTPMPEPDVRLPFPKTQAPKMAPAGLAAAAAWKPENLISMSADAAAPSPVLTTTWGLLIGSAAMYSLARLPLRRPSSSGTGFLWPHELLLKHRTGNDHIGQVSELARQ